MHKKVNIDEVRIGMFVADLDRPWIDTPFLLQGFLVEDQDQLAQLRQFCQWVVVDPQRSVGDVYQAPTAVNVSVQRPAAQSSMNVHSTQSRGAAPTEGPALRPPSGAARGQSPREFAIHVASKKAPQAATSITASPTNTNGATDGVPPEAMRSGIWGSLKSGVSGLFARKNEQTETPEDDTPAPVVLPTAPPYKRPTFLPESLIVTHYQDASPVEVEVNVATTAFERTSRLLNTVADDIRAGGALQIERVEEVITDMVESMIRNPDALMWVARMRENDLNVYGHGLSVAVSLVAFGRHLGFPKENLSQLGMLGLLLDVGKLKIPRELLEKTARLSADEFEQIKEHVDLGLDILKQTPNVHRDVLVGIAQHHERMNGTGYPNALIGTQIGIFGRMAAISDTYAALTKHRPYAKAISPHEALQMLSNWGGTQFHLEMVEQFIQSIGVFPVGSLVELSSGEVAVVVTHNKFKRLRPKVLVVTNAAKALVPSPIMLDLLYDVSENPVFIRRGLPSNAYDIDPREFYLG